VSAGRYSKVPRKFEQAPSFGGALACGIVLVERLR
jgi:hypothetical protein